MFVRDALTGALVIVVCFLVLQLLVDVRRTQEGFAPVLYKGPNWRTHKNDATRPCVVYYTKDRELCDRFDRGLVGASEMASVRFQQMQRDMKQYAEDGVCRLDLAPWREMTESTPKNVADTMSMDNTGKTDTWAFCYAPASSQASVSKVAKDIGNRGAYEAHPTLVTSLAGKPHARVQFHTLGYKPLKNAVCSMPQPVDPSIPSFLLSVSADGANRIQNLTVVMHKQGTIVPYPFPSEILDRLFVLQTRSGGIWLAPTQVSGAMCKLQFNPCGKPMRVGASKPVMVDAVAMGAKAVQLLVGGPGSDLVGSATDIRRHMTDLVFAQIALEKDLAGAEEQAALAAAQKPIAPAQGALLTRYTYSGGCGALNDSADLDRVFGRSVLAAGATAVKDPSFWKATEDMRAYVVEGFLLIPQDGRYMFSIQSDDGADLRVNDAIVATHYGYHPISDASMPRSVTMPTLKAGPVPFKGRVVECGGEEGIRLYWQRWNEVQNAWTPRELIPASAFVYDTTSQKQVADRIARIKKDLLAMQARVASVRQALDRLEADKKIQVTNALAQMVGKAAPWSADLRSNNGRYYIDVGIPERGMWVLNGAPDPSEIQVLMPYVTSIVQAPTVLPPPTIIWDKVEYTLSLWLRVDRPSPDWRNILLVGEQDDWTRMETVDRTPGLWVIHQNNAGLHFRHRSSRNFNDGVDMWGLRFGQWNHFMAVVTPQQIRLYLDGKLGAKLDLPANHNFLWNSRNKQLHLNYLGGVTMASGNMQIAKLYWANRALPETSGVSTGPSVASLFAEKP